MARAMDRCPSYLALEAFVLGGNSSSCASHVAACASCRHRLALMEVQRREFLESVFPSTVRNVQRAAALPRTGRRLRRTASDVRAAHRNR